MLWAVGPGLHVVGCGYMLGFDLHDVDCGSWGTQCGLWAVCCGS